MNAEDRDRIYVTEGERTGGGYALCRSFWKTPRLAHFTNVHFAIT